MKVPPVPAAAPAPAPADTVASFTWEDAACSYTGRYNIRKYTARQLADTYNLIGSGTLFTAATALHPEDVTKLSLDTLEAEYTKVRAHVGQLQLVPGAGWQELKRLKLREIDDQYRAMKLTILGYANPSLLVNSTYPAACKTYVRGLAANNDSMIIANWQQLVREQQKNNSIPESLQERFEQEATAPNWRAYAQVELMGFGWWNCINETIRRVEPTEKMHRQYEQLFTQVQSECEDVD